MRFPLLRKCSWHAFALGLSLLVLGASACENNDGYEEPGEELVVKNKHGNVVGRLLFPDKPKKKTPVVVIVPDSGAIDRNGNSASGLYTNAYIQLALRLSERGVAALRYDKAGVAFSRSAAPTAEEDVRFEMAAKDVALFTAELREDPRIGPITLVGHGVGALVAMLAHGEEQADAVVSLAGTAYSLDVELRELIEEDLDDKELKAEALAILDKLVAGKQTKKVSIELGGVFRPSVQPYLISWLKYDPVEELSNIDVPTLVVHGTTDLEVHPKEADVLAEGSTESELQKIKGMNHILKMDNGKTLSLQAQTSYADPRWKLSPKLVDVLVDFAKQ
jgi:alpha-beta hydrolase superfamily lysophospholipase